jgi:hypothetical protein
MGTSSADGTLSILAVLSCLTSAITEKSACGGLYVSVWRAGLVCSEVAHAVVMLCGVDKFVAP